MLALTVTNEPRFQLLLQRLEESISASSQDQNLAKVEEEAAREETIVKPYPKTDIGDYLSALDLRTVRQDSKRSSGCFGSRLDRIGSMSSLGCNTARRSGNDFTATVNRNIEYVE